VSIDDPMLIERILQPLDRRAEDAERLSGAGFRYKKLRDRESCSLSLNYCFWSVLSVDSES
jgi:hypothetical protein